MAKSLNVRDVMDKPAFTLFILAVAILEAAVIGTYWYAYQAAVKFADMIEIIKIVGALTAFAYAIHQYQEGQLWKQKQYLAAQLEKFGSSEKVQLVKQMLDWSSKTLKLGGDRTYELTSPKLKRLLCDEEVQHKAAIEFTSEEEDLRDAVDVFLDWLEQFQNDANARIILRADVNAYLGYWLKKLSVRPSIGDDEELAVKAAFRRYIDCYEYSGVLNLISQFDEACPADGDVAKCALAYERLFLSGLCIVPAVKDVETVCELATGSRPEAQPDATPVVKTDAEPATQIGKKRLFGGAQAAVYRRSAPAQTQYATIKTSAINLTKLRQRTEWQQILKMMRVFNDLSMSPYVSLRLETSYLPSIQPINVGVNFTLLRLRIAAVAEAMETVVDYLRHHEKAENHEVWRIIRKTPSLELAWTKLENYFSKGVYSDQLKSAIFIRDKLTCRYDDDASINLAFEKLLTFKAKDKIANAPIGLHIQGETGLVRNLLLDQLLIIALYDQYNLKVESEDVDDEEVSAFAGKLSEYLNIMANFINDLLINYCQDYDLVETSFEKPEWHERIRKRPIK